MGNRPHAQYQREKITIVQKKMYTHFVRTWYPIQKNAEEPYFRGITIHNFETGFIQNLPSGIWDPLDMTYQSRYGTIGYVYQAVYAVLSR